MMKRKLGIIIFVCISVCIFLYSIGCIIVSVYKEDIPTILSWIFAGGDIANTAVGALLGFGASLYLENYIAQKSKSRAIDNILVEVNDIDTMLKERFSSLMQGADGEEKKSEALERLIKAFDEKGVKYNAEYDLGLRDMVTKVEQLRYAIYVPIWESVLQNGDLLQFKNKEYFDCLIKCYTYILKIKDLINAREFDGSKTPEDNFRFLKSIRKMVINLGETIETFNCFDEIKSIDVKNLNNGKYGDD